MFWFSSRLRFKKKKQCSLGGLTRCVKELYFAHAPLAFITFATQNGLPVSSLRLCRVLETSFARQAPNPMMPYDRAAKTRNHAHCACVHLEYNCRGMDYSRAGTLHVGNRLWFIHDFIDFYSKYFS